MHGPLRVQGQSEPGSPTVPGGLAVTWQVDWPPNQPAREIYIAPVGSSTQAVIFFSQGMPISKSFVADSPVPCGSSELFSSTPFVTSSVRSFQVVTSPVYLSRIVFD